MPRRIYLSATNPVDPACASIGDFQKALRVREDRLSVITAIGQEFDATHPEDRSNWYEYDLAVTVSSTPSALELRAVPANAVNNLTDYKAFLLPLLSTFSLVDVAILDLGGNQTEVVLLRPDGINQPPGPLPLQPAGAPPLPDFVADVLSGAPWSQAKALPSMDNYIGELPGRFRLFPGLQGPQGVAMTAIYYECRFTIDSDGTGTDAGDHSHKPATSLHSADGNSLNASTMHFAVIPMDDIEALKEHANNLSFPQKQPGLPNFSADLGLKLGDVGVAFWRENASGPPKQAFFIYGDKGRPNDLGEGSMLLAKDLGMSDDPNNGGHTATEVTQMGKGIVHIGFPGSGQQFLVAGSSIRSNLVPDHIEDTARKFFAAFLSQPAALTPVGTGVKANIVQQSLNEWSFWGNSVPGQVGRTEDNPVVLPHLEAYWAEGVGDPHPGDHTTFWSAAFISFCMRKGGALGAFHYSGRHSVYISKAIQDRQNNNATSSFLGFRLTEYAPQIGDLVCWARQPGISYDNQPLDAQGHGDYDGHCDLVVAVNDGNVEVIGGNVSLSVTRRHLPIDRAGHLLPTAGHIEYLIAVMQNKLA